MPTTRKLSPTATVRVMHNAGLFSGMGFKGWRTWVGALAKGKLANPGFAYRMNAIIKGDDDGLVWEDGRYTFAELNTRINRLAHGLQNMGIGRGDRVALMSRNTPEMVEMMGAVYKLHGAPVTVGYRLTAPEVSYIVENSGSKALMVQNDYAEIGAEVAGSVACMKPNGVIVSRSHGDIPAGARTMESLMDNQPDTEPDPSQVFDDGDAMPKQPGLIIYTSGTTGKPKGAYRNASKVSTPEVLGMLSIVPLRRGDRILLPTPLYHSLALGMLAFGYGLGATILLMEKFDPEDVLKRIDRDKVTMLVTVPTMMNQILSLPDKTRNQYDLSSIRIILSSAAHFPHDLRMRTMDVFGPVLYDLYGATETGTVTIADPEGMKTHPGTIGRSVPGVTIALLDENKQEVNPGAVGELYAASGLLVDGYFNNPDATAENMYENFFSVGDLAYQDEDGYYYIADRRIDMVISGGVNIYPKEIEEVLHNHPAINDIAVIGIPDEKWGETLLALVVKQQDAEVSENDLVEYSRKELAGYKIPRRWEFVDVLPRNTTGKVMKKELRKQYAGASA